MTNATVGRGITFNTVTDGIDVFGGSLETFVDGDAGIGGFGFGFFKTDGEIGDEACREDDFVDVDNFLAAFKLKNYSFTNFVFFDCGNFARGQDGNTKAVGEEVG